MKIEFDKAKGAEKIAGIVQNTKEFGKRATENARNSVAAMVEKSKNDSYERRLKKYNPLFVERYQSEGFNLPNMIMIVDDAVRRGIDVCEGAIGWLGNEAGVEILYLYDEAVQKSGLKFVPAVSCDSIYYVDSFDRSRFIKVDCIFSKAHEEKMAELKHIAHALGAKRCSIEISESSVGAQSHNKKAGSEGGFKGISAKESYESSGEKEERISRSGRIEAKFQGSDTPEMPVLKWFAHDDNIKRLIEMRCSQNNILETETLELSGEAFATMSQKTACAIDGALGKIGGAKGHATLNAQAMKESHSKLLYIVEF